MSIIDDYNKNRPRMPAMRGIVQQYVKDGRVVVRLWPSKRGKPKTQEHKNRVDKFRNVNKALKYLDPNMQAQFRAMVDGTPLLPGDLLVAMLYNRLISIQTPDGKVLYPMVARQDVSASLDVLAQTQGMMLFRGPDFWIGIPPGEPGEVMQIQPDGSPLWVPAEAIGGGVGVDLGLVGNFTTARNAERLIVWDNVRHADAGFLVGPNNGTITFPASGLYQANFSASWGASGVGQRYAVIRVNGAVRALSRLQAETSFTNTSVSCCAGIQAVAGDTLQFLTFTSQTSSEFVNNNTNGSVIAV